MAAGEEIAKLFGTLGFKVDMRGVNKFENRIRQLESRMKSLGQSQSRTTQGAGRGLSDATAKARQHGKEISNVINRYDKYGAKVQRIREDFRRINVEHKRGNISLERRNQLLNDLTFQYRKAQIAARDYERSRGRGRPASLGPQMNSVMTSMIPGFGAGFAAMASVQSYQQALGMQQGLISATGSTEQAAQEFEYLQGVTQQLGLYIGDVGRSFTNMTAAARGTALAGEPVRRIFEGVSAQARVLNLSAADTEGVFRAVSQIMNKQTVMAEELKNQLGERMPSAVQATARAMGYLKENGEADTMALFKAMEASELTAEETLPKLAEEMLRTAKTGGALEMSMNNTSSAINRFRNTVFNANRVFNESGFDAAVGSLFERMATAIKEATPLWRIMGRAAEWFGMALEAPVELAGTLASKLGFLTEEGFKVNKVFLIAAASALVFVRRLRAIGFWVALLPYAIASLNELIENGIEGKSWKELALIFGSIALTIGMIVSRLGGVAKIIRTLKKVMGKEVGFGNPNKRQRRRPTPTMDDAVRNNQGGGRGWASKFGAAGMALRGGMRAIPYLGWGSLAYDGVAAATGLPNTGELISKAIESFKDKDNPNNLGGNGILAGQNAGDLITRGGGKGGAFQQQQPAQSTNNLNGDINFYIDGAQDGEVIQSQILETINDIFRSESTKNPQVEK